MDRVSEMLRLYAVTDRAWVGRQTLPQQVESALKGGATCVQLREKNLGDAAILAEALEIAALCRNYGVPFILNDNVTLAARCGADGVHLGQEDMDPAEARRILGPDKIIGASAHNVAEAVAAYQAGADYLGCGAVFGSATKTDASHLPEGELARVCAATPLPVVGIGGITEENLPRLAGSGVAGVALVSALFAPADKPAAVARLLTALEKTLG